MFIKLELPIVIPITHNKKNRCSNCSSGCWYTGFGIGLLQFSYNFASVCFTFCQLEGQQGEQQQQQEQQGQQELLVHRI